MKWLIIFGGLAMGLINLVSIILFVTGAEYDDDIEDNSMWGRHYPSYLLIKVLHRHIWGQVYKSERLNKFGKVFCEIAITIFLLPAILFNYVVSGIMAIFCSVFVKLFCKRDGE